MSVWPSSGSQKTLHVVIFSHSYHLPRRKKHHWSQKEKQTAAVWISFGLQETCHMSLAFLYYFWGWELPRMLKVGFRCEHWHFWHFRVVSMKALSIFYCISWYIFPLYSFRNFGSNARALSNGVCDEISRSLYHVLFFVQFLHEDFVYWSYCHHYLHD
jgi:hypothetical protein